jgi:hypothetical protein
MSAVWWVFGCGGEWPPLWDAPIVGGTEAQRADVAALLLAFDEATGGRARVERVEFVDISQDDMAGAHRGGAILVDPLGEAALPTVIFHELGHALADQDDLYAYADADTDALVDWVCAPEGGAVHPNCAWYRTDETRFSEAVARIVQLGPFWALDRATEACGDGWSQRDPALSTAIGQWALDHVWTTFREPERFLFQEALVRLQSTDPLLPATFSATDQPGIVAILPSGRDPIRVDLYSGEVVGGSATPAAEALVHPAGLDAVIAAEPRITGDLVRAFEVDNWVSPLDDGPTDGRRLAFTDGEWRFFEDPCGTHWDRTFTADGQAWLARWSDGWVWSPITAR